MAVVAARRSRLPTAASIARSNATRRLDAALGERFANPPRRLRIVGLPNFLVQADFCPIDRPVAKGQLHDARGNVVRRGATTLEHFIHAAAQFARLAAVAFEDDPVAAADGAGQLHGDMLAPHAADRPKYVPRLAELRPETNV